MKTSVDELPALDPRLGGIVAFVPAAARYRLLRRIMAVLLVLGLVDAVALFAFTFFVGGVRNRGFLLAAVLLPLVFSYGYLLVRHFTPRYGLAVCERGIWRDNGLTRLQTVFWSDLARIDLTASTSKLSGPILNLRLADPEAFQRARPGGAFSGLAARVRTVPVALASYPPPLATAQLIERQFEAWKSDARQRGSTG